MSRTASSASDFVSVDQSIMSEALSWDGRQGRSFSPFVLSGPLFFEGSIIFRHRDRHDHNKERGDLRFRSAQRAGVPYGRGWFLPSSIEMI